MQKNEENLSERETQLHQSIERLQAEQAAAHAAIASLDAEIASSKAALQAAQRRFDVLGDDGAAAEIESHRLTIAAAEAAKAETQKRLAEYPGRVAAVQNEIAHIGHRQNLRSLVDLRRAEVAAYNLAEQNILAAVESWRNFTIARIERENLARRVGDFARANGLPVPPSGGFNYPIPSENWFRSNAIVRTIEAEFERTRATIVEV